MLLNLPALLCLGELMGDMEKDQESSDKQSDSRKQWHPPQFFVAGLASTLTQGNGGTDGAVAGNTQS
jgi:hypothetical protein